MGRACNHRVWLQRAIQEAKKAHASIACKTYKGYLQKTTKKFAAYQSSLDLYEKVPLHVGQGFPILIANSKLICLAEGMVFKFIYPKRIFEENLKKLVYFVLLQTRFRTICAFHKRHVFFCREWRAYWRDLGKQPPAWNVHHTESWGCEHRKFSNGGLPAARAVKEFLF